MQALSGKLCLVTGASAGIGAATARALIAAGAQVVLAARRIERVRALAAELGPRAQALELDVRDYDACSKLLGSQAFDLAVANAGMALGTDRIDQANPADWSEVIDTNIKGLLHTVRAVTPKMVERGRGDLVLLGSVAGRQVYPGGGVYCATKFAVRALYEGLRLDLAGKGLRIATVDPGMVHTEFSLVRMRGDQERAAKVYQGLTPLAPADVADAIVWIVTRPAHINVGELVLWPTDQASVSVVHRRETSRG